jgi:hypothetical protein
VAERRQHVERIARLEPLVRPGREHTARIALDRDAQRAVLDAGADRIRPANVLPPDVGAQREMLSRGVAKRFRERVGNRERDRDRIARLGLDPRDRKRWNLLIAPVRRL